ncbi:MAG: hypothetical protein LBR89_00815 [Holosporales bacterium]|nr:hypothetical protein [Holosporales bacterium]
MTIKSLGMCIALATLSQCVQGCPLYGPAPLFSSAPLKAPADALQLNFTPEWLRYMNSELYSTVDGKVVVTEVWEEGIRYIQRINASDDDVVAFVNEHYNKKRPYGSDWYATTIANHVMLLQRTFCAFNLHDQLAAVNVKYQVYKRGETSDSFSISIGKAYRMLRVGNCLVMAKKEIYLQQFIKALRNTIDRFKTIYQELGEVS